MEIQNNSNTADLVAAENSDIVFDTSSGIPESEQREILAGIENITVANQLALTEERPEFRAKRGGGAFPLIVNIAALLLLAGGVFLLYVFHNKGEAQIRQGRTVYNAAERVLIQEIRRETARELEEKEREISLIISKLTGVDAELQELYSNNHELNAEQHTVELNLQRLQEEYRSSLGSLQNERSRILETSRAREASLRTQLEERTRELTAVSEQSNAALTAARSELERVSGDAEKAAAIEAQLGAHFAAAAAQIRAGNFDSAVHTLVLMREFLNTPAFQSIRSIQLRKELYLASIDALEGMVAEAEKNEATIAALQAGSAAAGMTELEQTIVDLQAQNAGLEATVADLNRTLGANTSQGAELNRRINEFETTITGLRNQVSTQQRTLTERESAVTTLQSQNANLTRTVTERESTITELRAQNTDQAARIETLNTQLANIRQTLQSLSE